MQMYDDATATTADPNPPSTSNEREGTTSATASTATRSISDERELRDYFRLFGSHSP